MSEILSKIHNVDPNDSDAAKEAVTTFFHSLSKVSGSDSIKWLRSLVAVINRFPRYCMTHRTTAENIFIKYLDSNNVYNVIEAAKGAHLLQQVRPSQEKIATPKTCWREQLHTLCHAAHKLISALFTNSIDLYQNGDSLDLQSLNHSPLTNALLNLNNLKNTKTESEKKTILSTRLRNIFIFIQAMLVEIYPVAKSVRPQAILDVVVRTLSVTSGKNVTSTHNLSDICTIKTQALRTLDALAACLGSNLLPFSALLIRLPLQTLRWSAENVNEESRKVRAASYQSLTNWLCVLRVSADGGRWHDDVTSQILADVTTGEKQTVTFTAQPIMKNLSKKAKRKLQSNMLQQSSLAAHMAGEKNKIHIEEKTDESVALAALDCAEAFLTVCGAFLKPAIHQQFQERIVRECYTVTSHYKRCLGLLRVLEAARKSCRNIPPPTQYCLALYGRLVNSPNPEVSKFCVQAIQDIRLHLHCSPPSINFALEPQKEITVVKSKEKTVSEKNRAALEALLGKSNMPSKTPSPKPDSLEEPSPKRAKMISEDLTERISLSSDSVQSVEISDDSDNEQIEIVESNHIQSSNEQTIEKEGNSNKKVNELNSIQNKENINEAKTQINIFEAKTQIPANDSHDAVDGEDIPLSNEVGYDLPNTASNKVPVLEKMDDENLPSTNETDDVQITCGQLVANSQDAEKKDEPAKTTAQVNGLSKSPEKEVKEKESDAIAKMANDKENVSVDDMLADFVDEVNEEINEK